MWMGVYMDRKELNRRLILMIITWVELLIQVGLYEIVWYFYYYQRIIRYDSKLYFKGFILVLVVYMVFLYLFTNTYGGLKIGVMKRMELFLSHFFALLGTNAATYCQLSLMHGYLVPPGPLLAMTAVQILFAGIWVALAYRVYRRIYPPRKLLLIYGERSIDDIMHKFASRKDKYDIVKCSNIREGADALLDEVEKDYDGVVLWDIPTEVRNKLLKYCYSRSIRVYMMPKIPDVIVKGAEQLHLFDTPILLTREFALTVEQQIMKRCIDIVCALLLLVLASPFMLVTAVLIRLYDGGPVLYRQIRCTIGGRQFGILKFRSMRVDAEKDGVARLASRNDSRITPIGHFIRAVRIDELPQLFNILKGDMSFIGPRPERPEIISRYLEEMPEFAFRMKVKAGLAGYAQVYGKYNTTPYDKLKLDLTYIENYSLWLDIKLCFLTVKILFQKEKSEGVEDDHTTALQ